MKRWMVIVIAWLYPAVCLHAARGSTGDITVDAKGERGFTSIQTALNSIPAGKTERTTIFIRNGLYNEKVFIHRSHLVIVGETRDSTRIVFAELRENWNRDHQGSDSGAAVVNIDTGVTDVTLANLTIYNNYGSLYGAFNKHQFALYGKGTRIILLRCTIVSDGGDALSLWNRRDGMYYHENCNFEGWVDYVCPRGWCYVSDSRFFGHNKPSASIWHDGSTDKRQKFVIVNSFFDGVSGFPLGRNHLDAQFYLIGCRFSPNMADRPFLRPPSSPRPWKWGDRHYFYDCHRDGGDYEWFRDNLSSAGDAPKPEEITPRWAFDGQWDPESEIPQVLPMAFHPRPVNFSKNIPAGGVRLSWRPARNTTGHEVYIGTSDSLVLAGNTRDPEFFADTLKPRTTYFWRVDETTDQGVVRGDLWSFTTMGDKE